MSYICKVTPAGKLAHIWNGIDTLCGLFPEEHIRPSKHWKFIDSPLGHPVCPECAVKNGRRKVASNHGDQLKNKGEQHEGRGIVAAVGSVV